MKEKIIEALKAALGELPELSSAPMGREPRAIRAARLVIEAIAVLEKPVEPDVCEWRKIERTIYKTSCDEHYYTKPYDNKCICGKPIKVKE